MRDRMPEPSPDVARQLRAYGALDHAFRFRAYRTIHDHPGVSFNEIVRETDVASGLAAYHLGVLRAAGLVEVQYVRSGMAVSRYELTEMGARIFENLFGRRRAGARHPAKSASKVLA